MGNGIVCPKCQGQLKRMPRLEWLVRMGLLDLFLHVAVGRLRCENCGVVRLEELPREDYVRVRRLILWVVGGAVLILVVALVPILGSIEWDL